MIDRLAVHLAGARVGTLTADDESSGSYSFAFGPDVVSAREGDVVISVSLPVRDEPYGPRAARPFFDGLLPERGVREAIARNLKVSDENSFGLLAELGRDSAGAVVLLPEGDPLPAEGSTDWLTEQELENLIARLPMSPLGISNTSKIRLSLAGLQRKAVLVRSGGGTFGEPNEIAPSTHILKPQYADTPFNYLVYNEAFCMRVAECVGLSVARTELIFVGEAPCLLVERFDRSSAGGTRIRLHQEDFCQALGILPGLKYENEGGPGFPAIVELVRDVSRRAGADVLALIRAIAVNFALGNNDAHARNFALLYGEQGIQLAPLYDIVSTAVYPDVEDSMAMSIGDQSKAAEVKQSDLRELARRCDLNPTQLLEEWERTVEKTARCAESVARLMEVEGLHVPVIDQILEVTKQRST